MNRATLAVAGARKTQSIVDACCDTANRKRRLVLTYTISAQHDVEARLRRGCSTEQLPDVSGWYTFLLHHWVRPYLPLLYPGRRLTGLNFDERTGVDYATGESRYLDSESRAYKRYLSKLALDVAAASDGAVIDRLEHIYDEIHIDEVQDLTGYDLDIIQALLASKINIRLVGDVRQSTFNTNPQDPRNKQYRDLKMLDWFALQQSKGRLGNSALDRDMAQQPADRRLLRHHLSRLLRVPADTVAADRDFPPRRRLRRTPRPRRHLRRAAQPALPSPIAEFPHPWPDRCRQLRPRQGPHLRARTHLSEQPDQGFPQQRQAARGEIGLRTVRGRYPRGSQRRLRHR